VPESFDPITVAIAGEHTIVRTGLRVMLASASDMRVIAKVSTIAAGGATGRQMAGEASEAVARTARPPIA
jgi:DNA-binding NarL/FixJ family response regulator